MKCLWTGEATLCEEVAAEGRTRLASYTPDDFRERIAEVVCRACGCVGAPAEVPRAAVALI